MLVAVTDSDETNGCLSSNLTCSTLNHIAGYIRDMTVIRSGLLMSDRAEQLVIGNIYRQKERITVVNLLKVWQ